MSRNPAQPILPDFSRLGLVRTGMSGRTRPSAPAPAPAPAPALAPDDFLESPDFFRAVLEQVKNVEDLRDACEIAKTWCALDRGRKAACAESDDAWKELARTLFTQYVPDPSEGVTWERHFYSLCKMDPIDRLEMAAKERMAVLLPALKTEMDEAAADQMSDEEDEEDDVFPNPEEDNTERLHQQAMRALFRDGGAIGSERTMAPNDAWTTERDDRADVTIALTRQADALEQWGNAFVQACVVGAIIDLVTSVGPDFHNRPSMRQREQAARLTAWLFRARPDIEVVRPLGNIHMARTSWMDHLSDWLYTTIQWGLFSVPRASAEELYEHSDRVTLCLEALKSIAIYKDDDDFHRLAYATPREGSRGRTSCHFSASALKYYLDHGNEAQKDLICKIIAFSLHVPVNEVASGMKPWDRQLEFAKELARTRAMDVLGTVGIGNLNLSRASVAAISSIAEQLAQHAWGRSWN